MRKKKTLILMMASSLLLVFGGCVSGKQQATSNSPKNRQSVTAPNGLKFTIKNKELSKYMGKNDGNELLVLSISAENNSKEDIPLGAVDFEAVLSSGEKVTPDSNYNGFYNEMKPKDKKEESLYFKIPKSKKAEKLLYHVDEKKVIDIDLSN